MDDASARPASDQPTGAGLLSSSVSAALPQAGRSVRRAVRPSADRAARPLSMRFSSLRESSDDAAFDWGVHEVGRLVLGGGGGGGGGGEPRISSGALIAREMQRVGQTLRENAPPPASCRCPPAVSPECRSVRSGLRGCPVHCPAYQGPSSSVKFSPV